MTWVPVKVPKPGGKRAPKGLKRTRMKSRNAKRKGRAFGATRVDEAYLTWIRGMPCAICAALGCKQEHPTEAEHFVDKSHGGFDRGDTFPTCGAHRILRHEQWGKKAFERRMREHFKLDLRALCDHLAHEYVAGLRAGTDPQ